MSNILKKVYENKSGDRIFQVWHGNIEITIHRSVDQTHSDIISVYDHDNNTEIITEPIRKPYQREQLE